MSNRAPKVAFSFPPIVNELGQRAMVSQNRNVQYFIKPTFLVPVVHAQAATALRDIGCSVFWDDGNAEGLLFDQWLDRLCEEKPDIVILESTTPVMKFFWRLTETLKGRLPNAILCITGYHSMRMPGETFENSLVDVVVTSPHVDFVIQRMLGAIIGRDRELWMQSFAEVGGLVIRDGAAVMSTGHFSLVEDVDRSAIIDRDLTRWKLYSGENGNFLMTPGAYATSVIRDCSFGKCTFCRYNGADLTYSQMDVKKSVDEYEVLITKYGVKEIFDDSGVWFRGKDAREFANEIISRGLHKKGCYFGFNTRFEYLDRETIFLLAKANFRFVLLGFEAADQETLMRLKKGYSNEHVEQCLRWMTEAGLHPHLTVMVGYYWQTQEQLNLTVRTVKRYMFQGLARTLQVTICTPLDFTEYHKECIREGVLLTEDYDDHDMSKLIVKTPIPHERYYEAIREMYGVAFHPRYLLRCVAFLLKFRPRDWQFLFVYGVRAARRVRQHMYNLTEAKSGH